jgi:hypothetical protein
MVNCRAIPTPISLSNEGDASMAAPHNNGPETNSNQEADLALEDRVYRTLARCYVLEHRKLHAKKKKATSVFLTLLSASFFIGMMAFVYWIAR